MAIATQIEISEGVEGVKETIALMSSLVKQYKTNAYCNIVARQALAMVPARDAGAELTALCEYVQRTVRYTADTADTELIITPDLLLREVQAGDCDDMSLCLATLCECVGYKTRFVACGFVPGDLSHVFVQVRLGGFDSSGRPKWMSLDASEQMPPGWQAPDMKNCYVRHN
jgi:transglutaminase-like putative cysteine protease